MDASMVLGRVKTIHDAALPGGLGRVNAMQFFAKPIIKVEISIILFF